MIIDSFRRQYIIWLAFCLIYVYIQRTEEHSGTGSGKTLAPECFFVCHHLMINIYFAYRW